MRVPCKPEYVRTIRRTVAEFAESIHMPHSAVEEVEIATSEAMANVIRHAYRGWEVTPPVRVRCERCNGSLTVEIVDRGCGFDAPPRGVIPEVDPDREGGLGIILIKSFMDRVHYSSKPGTGTRIRMTKHTRSSLPSRHRHECGAELETAL